jgi:hypothetical protein
MCFQTFFNSVLYYSFCREQRGTKPMNIEERASNLEKEVKSGHFSRVSDELFKESMENPQEFSALVKKLAEKNTEDRQQNPLLPKIEFHEEGNDVQKFFGMSKVDHVEVKTSMLTRNNEADGDLYSAPQKMNGASQSMLDPVASQKDAEVIDVNSMLRAGGNIFSSVFDGFQNGNTSKINQGGADNAVRMYNGQPLQKQGFGSWKDQH